MCGGWHNGRLRLFRRGYESQPEKCLRFSLLYVPDTVEQVKHVLQHCFVKYLYAQHRWNIAGYKVEQLIGWRSTCSTSLFQKVEQAQPL
ncbi:hypothetical protein DV603_10710 [Salmonella enterica]|uniref:Uncharacterized protein n=1 Tax=Salmonella enterica subsp. enterica serovar Braenderup TaxID=149391 RepID=A0A609ATS7_SALET|nr:hypothetical protein [Salmonella enterica]ECT0409940.1 hypothetical protein [Salmonella enterica subsp. enterica serovar Braenderup]EBJ5078642.1 hypothetical protein [Salmonella enterica]EBJ5087102.1 hypothetical protein [Salmonella enterica]EBM2082866.1 hypothetical protein [Salmonella enterica]